MDNECYFYQGEMFRSTWFVLLLTTYSTLILSVSIWTHNSTVLLTISILVSFVGLAVYLRARRNFTDAVIIQQYYRLDMNESKVREAKDLYRQDQSRCIIDGVKLSQFSQRDRFCSFTCNVIGYWNIYLTIGVLMISFATLLSLFAFHAYLIQFSGYPGIFFGIYGREHDLPNYRYMVYTLLSEQNTISNSNNLDL